MESQADLQWMLSQQKGWHRGICRGLPFDYLKEYDDHELMERTNEIRTPLFLYSMSVNEGKDKFMDIYRRDAHRQYLKSPHAYNTVWKDVLPENIYREALTAFGVVFS